jgi:hypothetical protein
VFIGGQWLERAEPQYCFLSVLWRAGVVVGVTCSLFGSFLILLQFPVKILYFIVSTGTRSKFPLSFLPTMLHIIP